MLHSDFLTGKKGFRLILPVFYKSLSYILFSYQTIDNLFLSRTETANDPAVIRQGRFLWGRT